MDELLEMLADQLKDAHSAERQAIQGMKRTLRKASDQQLRQGIEAHIAQSEEHRERVEQALEMLSGKPDRKVCEAMRGLVEEAAHEMEEHDKGPVLDLVIVAGQQRIEHYEIAAYGTMVELAEALGKDDVAGLLAEILVQEKAQDEKLTEVTRSAILPAALRLADQSEDEEAEEGGDSKPGHSRKNQSRQPSPRGKSPSPSGSARR